MLSVNWYLIQSKPREEERALANLERQGFEAFLPRIERRVRHARRWRTRIEALFPRYLFARLDQEVTNWAPIRSTAGVSTIVRFGGRPARVPEAIVDDLLARADAGGVVHTPDRKDFEVGQAVRICEGPLTGIEGVITAKTSRERVDLLLSLVAQGAKARVTEHQLEPVQH